MYDEQGWRKALAFYLGLIVLVSFGLGLFVHWMFF